MATAQVAIWTVTERIDGNDCDWYCVFARSVAEAIKVVVGTHYDGMGVREYKRKYNPTVKRVPDGERMLVGEDGVWQFTKTARAWAKGQKPGPFTSNTYEI